MTGELTLDTTPACRIFLRDGVVYFAERVTDGMLAIRLVMEGVVSRDQIRRGTVHVNGVEHIGRLFDADATVHRASVELCVELFTEDVLVSVANEPVSSYEMALYRRHPGGIDRWFAPAAPAAIAIAEPVSAVVDAQIAEPAFAEPAVVGQAEFSSIAAEQVIEPNVIEPVVAEPVVVEPVIAEPAPVEAQPVDAGPAVVEAVIVEPVIVEPVIVEPVVSSPAVASGVAAVVVPQRNTLASPPITQAVPIVRSASLAPPTEQLPVVVADTADQDAATAIADGVAEAIRRAFAGVNAGV
jgi:hypothetical protein